MNAPAQFEHLPLIQIAPSDTPMQALRRRRFVDRELQALAESFAAVGMLEPMLVRPHPHPSAHIAYEIVAGERRYHAAGLAGLVTVPALVRPLDDAQVIEIQLIENLQRQDLHPLEEAEGYKALMAASHLTVNALAARIGKSRSWVYARTRLLALCPEAQAALQAGELDASTALLLARFRSKKLQQQALKLLRRTGGDSYRRVVETLRRELMADLGRAPFALDDAELLLSSDPAERRRRAKAEPQLVACTGCPHNSANDPELQSDLPEGAHVCTHVPCFDLKVTVHWERQAQAAREAGRTLLQGEAARAAIPGRYDHGTSADYVALDARCEDLDFAEPAPKETGDVEADAAAEQAWLEREAAFADNRPTFRVLLGAAAPESVFAQDPKSGALVELADIRAVAKRLKAQGIKLRFPSGRGRGDPRVEDAPDPEADAAAREKEQKRDTLEREYRRRLLAAIHAKWGKAELKREELEYLATAELNNTFRDEDELRPLYGGQIVPAKLQDHELVRLLAECFALHDFGVYRSAKPGRLLYLAHRLKIDPKKIRAAAVAALAFDPADPAARAKQRAAKPKGKKK